MKPLHTSKQQASKQKMSRFSKPAAKALALSLLVACLTMTTAFAYGRHVEGSAQAAAQAHPAAANRVQAGDSAEPTPRAAAEAAAARKRDSRAGQAAEGNRNREPGAQAQPDRTGETPGTPASKVVPQDLCSLGMQESPTIRVSYTISTMPACLKKMLSLNHLVLPNDETPQDLSGFSANPGNSVSV